MKMVLAMLVLFCVTGMMTGRVTRLTYVTLGVSIVGILAVTRLMF